jgi:hypothetical protein
VACVEVTRDWKQRRERRNTVDIRHGCEHCGIQWCEDVKKDGQPLVR